jgi:hypothetical protein
MPLERTEPRTIYQHSKYISSDEEEASEAWDTILPGHGVVAIEPDYARSKKLPETVILPDSGGKLTYVIEAYHAIHCVVRLLLYDAVNRANSFIRPICASTMSHSSATRPDTGQLAMTGTALMR